MKHAPVIGSGIVVLAVFAVLLGGCDSTKKIFSDSSKVKLTGKRI